MDLRPRPDQTDEDLVKENKEFMLKMKRKANEISETSTSHDDKRQRPIENVEDFIHNIPSTIIEKARAPELLLTDIIEKNVSKVEVPNVPPISKLGFPVAFRRDKSLHSNTSQKGSIFARMQKKSVKVETKIPETQVNPTLSSILGDSESKRIHEENLQKLSTMTQEEILEAQRELLSKLDPSIVALLKAKKNASPKMGTQIEETPKESTTNTIPIKITDAQMETEENGLHDLPINPIEARKWLHMDVVETDKLRWMTQLPKPKPVAPGQSYAARFGFDGTLMDPKAEVDVTKSLHHHGDEQERPGYTLEELLLFSRSATPQQRVIGLTTIANILALAKQGRLDKCLEEPILPQLLSAGVFAALRFSLDEGIPMVTEAAVQALTEIICSEPDEVCLRQLRGTSYGVTLPNLSCPLEEEGPKEKGQEALEEGELKDHELLQLDVVKGAMRTTLVPRIRYLLEMTKAGPKTVQCLLRVLTRLAMHSREVALDIAACPDLLSTIIKHFLPSSWEPTMLSPAEIKNVYGVPQARVLSLLRVLASQSRMIASDLVHKYNIMKSLLAYLSAEPCETGIPDGPSVVLEALYMWQTLLNHALTMSELQEFSGVLGRLLSHHTSQTSLGAPRFLLEHAVALLSVLQTVITLSHSHSDKVPRELIVSLSPVLLHATARWLKDATSNASLSFTDMKLVGAGLNIVSTSFHYALNWPEVDEVSWLSQLEAMLNSVMIPFIASSTMKHLTNSLLSHSSLLNSESNSGSKRDSKGLPSVGACMWGQTVTPSMQVSSPIPLLEPLAAFIVCSCEMLAQKTTKLLAMLELPGVKNYLQKISDFGCAGSGHWFSRWEERLSCCLLSLAAKSSSSPDNRMLHCAALNLVPALTFPQLTRDLMATWVFSQRAFQDDFTSGLLSNLNLAEACSLPTVVASEPTSPSDLLQKSYDNLSSITTSYNMYEQLPQDWPFLPLVNAAEIAEKSPEKVNAKQIEHCLQWVLLLETCRPEICCKMLTTTGRFCRISCLFLTGSDIFLDPTTHALAEAIIRKILASGSLDFTETIPGLKSFWELFVALARSFVAESYGDVLFANVLLMPLQQNCEPAYRKHIWGEQAAALRFLRLQKSQLLVDIQRYLEPQELDTSLLVCYLNAVASGTLTGVLTTIAIGHLQKYTENGEDQALKSRIVSVFAKNLPNMHNIIN